MASVFGYGLFSESVRNVDNSDNDSDAAPKKKIPKDKVIKKKTSEKKVGDKRKKGGVVEDKTKGVVTAGEVKKKRKVVDKASSIAPPLNKKLWSVDVDCLHERGGASSRKISDCTSLIEKHSLILSSINTELKRRDLPVMADGITATMPAIVETASTTIATPIPKKKKTVVKKVPVIEKAKAPTIKKDIPSTKKIVLPPSVILESSSASDDDDVEDNDASPNDEEEEEEEEEE